MDEQLQGEDSRKTRGFGEGFCSCFSFMLECYEMETAQWVDSQADRIPPLKCTSHDAKKQG